MSVKPSDDSRSGATRRRPGPAPTTSREQILTAALRIVDEQGLERLTMRRLGAELDVDPMTVYHYVPDKAALFDGLVERVFSEVELPRSDERWEDSFRALARAFRLTLLRHADAVVLVGTRPPISEAAFDLVEAATRPLLAAGFTEEQAADGVDCLGRLVIGHALTEAGRPPGGDVSGGEAEHVRAQQELSADRYPTLASVERAAVAHDPNRLFELALRGLVLALELQLKQKAD
jgi:TetR/AcrR family transcriptional regulator, tetracycline repressor protein